MTGVDHMALRAEKGKAKEVEALAKKAAKERKKAIKAGKEVPPELRLIIEDYEHELE